MPQTGGPIKRPTPKPKPKPKTVLPATDTSVGGNKDAGKPIGPPTLADIPKSDQIGGKNNPSKVNKKGVVVPKASSSDAYKAGFTNEKSYTKGGTITQAAANKLGLDYKGASVKPSPKKAGTREYNAERFGISSGGYSPPVSRDMAYTRPGGGGTRGGNYDHTTIAERGANDGGRLSGGFADHDLVGSHNTIDEFDGSTFAGGAGPEGGGGGGTGSSTAGREAVGLVDYAGKSLEEAVYGVKRRRGKVAKARGE